MEQHREKLNKARVLILGRSFKEDCPDTRNSKTFILMDALWNRGAEVFNFDPVAFDDHFEGGRGVKIIDDPFAEELFDAVIITLSHTVFREQFDGKTLTSLCKKHGPLIDMRGNFKTTKPATGSITGARSTSELPDRIYEDAVIVVSEIAEII